MWHSTDSLSGPIGTDKDILVSRSTDAGATWTAPAPLNANAASDSGDDEYPQVATDRAGHWISVWQSKDSLRGTIGTDHDILFASFTEFAWDYGDAPSPYATLLADGGARHAATGPKLGPDRDREPDGQPDEYAEGDDSVGSDDEDGVTLGTLLGSVTLSMTGSVTVDLQNPDSTSNILSTWIDFNQDGDWEDAGERILADHDLGTGAGPQGLTFTIPAGATSGTTFARFRLSTSAGLTPTGPAPDGEVEDYALSVMIDATPPSSSISFPIDGAAYDAAAWSDSLWGTASDTGGGSVSQVKVSIKRLSDNLYWSGSAFNQPAEYFVTATGTTDWSLPFPDSNLTDGVSYTVHARSTDTAGNVEIGTTVTFAYEATPLTPGDFNDDGVYDEHDIDALVAEIAAGTHTVSFDLTGDGLVNLADRDAWLAEAGAINLPSGNSYQLGDANLDGFVDVSDFGIWNAHKFTSVAAWSAADWNADGVVDVSDFGIWNAHKFQAADGMSQSLGFAAQSPLRHVNEGLTATQRNIRNRSVDRVFAELKGADEPDLFYEHLSVFTGGNAPAVRT